MGMPIISFDGLVQAASFHGLADRWPVETINKEKETRAACHSLDFLVILHRNY